MILNKNTQLKHGEYVIIDSLGQGGFGITYLAEQVSLKRKVAIKEFFLRDFCNRDSYTLRVSSTGSTDVVERFRDKFIKEAYTIAGLDHPNIVRIIDVFEENDTAYYVMEYHSGYSLGSVVDKQGAMSEEQALRYIRQVASALKYIHSRRMMHLDIKPDNILLNSRGEAVLIDFGISKVFEDEIDNVKRPRTSTIAAYSPGFAPKEQYNPKGVTEFSPATDIYSLGATLFTLLIGECPPPAIELDESDYIITTLKRSNISKRLSAAVIKAMAYTKKDRPQSVDEFFALLNGGSKEPKKPFNWKPLVGIIAAILCIVFAGVGINECNSDISIEEQIRLDSIAKEKARQDSFAAVNRYNDSIAKVKRPNDSINKALANKVAEQQQLDSIANEKAPQDSIAAVKRYNDSIAMVKQHNDSINKALANKVAEQQQLDSIANEKARQESIAAVKRYNDSIANLPGELYVDTNPVGAIVTVDGKRIGTTPINAYKLKKGSYTVKITKDGYKEYRQNITVSYYRGNSIYVRLDKVEKPQPQDKVKVSSNSQKLTFAVKGIEFKMVAVAGGTFNMGSNDGGSNESPVHSVTLSDYYIGETEVTQELWKAVMGSNPSYFKGDKNPVDMVSYNDCIDFINKLNSLLAAQLPAGRKFRLPTEAQWEFAARGGNKGKNNNNKYSGSNSIDDVAWYRDNSSIKTHPVKQKQPNELGLYDMSGNMWEWCSDWYDTYLSSSQTDPKGPSSFMSRYRVLRGGSWIFNAQYCRVAYRSYGTPGYRLNYYGLRLAF